MQNRPFLLRFNRLLAAGVAFPCLAVIPHAAAQQLQEPQTTISAPDAPVPENDDQIGFSADALEYDSNKEVVTANGNGQLLRDGKRHVVANFKGSNSAPA